MAAVTMMDIARKAKVSRPTVSMVLNGRANQVKISEKTKQLVLEVSKSLGYRRNEIARSMVTGRTNFIVFVGDLSSEYCSTVLKGVVEKAKARNFFVKIFSNADFDNFSDQLNSIIEQRPAGIIFRSVSKDDFTCISDLCRQYDIPFAIAGSSFPGSCGIRVYTADEEGAAMAVEHFAELGHKKIAHISGDRSHGYVELRRTGFLEKMSELSLTLPDNYLINDDNIDSIEQATATLLTSANRPTAIFCASDPVALVVIRAARSVGLKVPEELSVIGFANMYLTQLTDPPLTTVAEPFVALGRTVAGELINEIEDKKRLSFNKQVEQVLEVELIVRGSTGPVKTPVC